MSKFWIVLRWTLIVLVTVAFLALGVMKLMGKMSSDFHAWGYPSWFVYVVGVGEILGAVGLYLKKTAGWSLMILGIISAAAALTHIGHHEGLVAPLPAIGLLLCVIGVGYLNAKQNSASK